MNTKRLIIANDNSDMSVFINANNKIVLNIESYEGQFENIELDHKDAIALIKELKELSKLVF